MQIKFLVTVGRLCNPEIGLRTSSPCCKNTGCKPVIFRSPNIAYMSADLGCVAILSIYQSSIFVFSSASPLPAELAERNSTKTGHMLGSKGDLKMHVRNLGYTHSLQIGAPKPPFSTISQLNDKFNDLCLRNETRYTQSDKCVDNYKGPATSSRRGMNFCPQTASNWTCILSTLHKFCFLHCVSKNDTDVAHYNFNAHQPILAIFGTYVTERACNQTVTCYPTSLNKCVCTTWGNINMNPGNCFFSAMLYSETRKGRCFGLLYL